MIVYKRKWRVTIIYRVWDRAETIACCSVLSLGSVAVLVVGLHGVIW